MAITSITMPAFEAFLKFAKADAACAVHSLAEVFACVTRMPGNHRMSSAQAMLFLGNVRERLDDHRTG